VDQIKRTVRLFVETPCSTLPRPVVWAQLIASNRPHLTPMPWPVADLLGGLFAPTHPSVRARRQSLTLRA